MKHYTAIKAVKEIGKSIAWRDARKVSIKKWKEIAKYGQRYYSAGDACGHCIVEDNRTFKGLHSMDKTCGQHCPARRICSVLKYLTSQEIVIRIRKLKR